MFNHDQYGGVMTKIQNNASRILHRYSYKYKTIELQGEHEWSIAYNKTFCEKSFCGSTLETFCEKSFCGSTIHKLHCRM